MASILPQGSTLGNDDNIEEITQQTRTYKLDFESGRVLGFCDEIEALKQAIRLILSTERYEYLIYSWNYGSELKGVIGIDDKEIAESEFKRRVKEALMQDERINNVDNFTFSYDKDSVLVGFTVFSIYGELKTDKLVIS